MPAATTTLRVSEIFLSLQGESTRMGLPCAFVRLAGCNLDCTWCDTPYARGAEDGEPMALDAILAELALLGCPRVEVTGGEPMTQPATPQLLAALCEAGYETLLETNGSLDLSGLDPRVRKIVDVKCPSSGAAEAMCWANFDGLSGSDEVKFVLADRADFDYACHVVRDRNLTDHCAVHFSPVAGRLEPARLAEWILETGLDVRLGLQLHKILWPGEDRGR